ncbi:MAG TPA: type II secretion system F family protein [Solimonas sp.]|nr:type II secretion system F family protein [Solimonas sp.]
MKFSLLVFVLALGFAAGAIFLFLKAGKREHHEELQLRLRALGGDEAAAALAGYKPLQAQLSNPLLRWACYVLWRTGAEVEPATVARILLVLALLIPVTLFAFGAFVGVVTVVVVIAFGWAFLTRRAAHRRARILEQMPAFLEAAIRVLSAGNTLEESIAAAARESPEPIRPLFVSVGRQVRLGAQVDAVLMETAEIHQIRDIKVMALAAAVNRKFGGSLRNILRSLIQTIRSRDSAARELRALTAETRFSALVLSIIPVSLTLYILAQNPKYYTQMWADTGGRALLVTSILMQIAGIFVIFRMMRSTEDNA